MKKAPILADKSLQKKCKKKCFYYGLMISRTLSSMAVLPDILYDIRHH